MERDEQGGGWDIKRRTVERGCGVCVGGGGSGEGRLDKRMCGRAEDDVLERGQYVGSAGDMVLEQLI